MNALSSKRACFIKIQSMFQGLWDLRVDFTFNGADYYAVYSNFSIAGESENYQLSIGEYRGTAGDDLRVHDNLAFSTFDRDNDPSTDKNCASHYQGAWWFHNCVDVDLNGMWGKAPYASGVMWVSKTGHYNSASMTEMKTRRV